jgi:hypothetical protein
MQCGFSRGRALQLTVYLNPTEREREGWSDEERERERKREERKREERERGKRERMGGRE